MENVKGGTSGRGCMLMGAASVIACAIPGGGLIAGISIFAAAAAQDCFYAVPVESKEAPYEMAL
ncbi:hypothetical protein [Flavobacterium ginsengisoli]